MRTSDQIEGDRSEMDSLGKAYEDSWINAERLGVMGELPFCAHSVANTLLDYVKSASRRKIVLPTKLHDPKAAS